MTSPSDTQYTNALISETSPYLLQHVHQPVQWYPWGENALTLAKQLDKPILLSIGYSACHWCHVMAHESFEDPKIATVMNQLFVNIKVDREERPDLDKIYQLAHQLLTQRTGGWPLTMFLTPDTHYPFFGGTYFPPTPRYGMPAFIDILKKVAEFYHAHQDQIREQNSSLASALDHYLVPKKLVDVWPIRDTETLYIARREIAERFETKQGGFSKAPKFPNFSLLERLLHHYILTTRYETPDVEGLEMALFSLKKMALGGLYDQLGGGFYRYAIDDTWMIPHFEKMLYDNGYGVAIYSQAWQLLHIHPELSRYYAELGELFKRVAMETATWVIREMRSSEGGFYSSLDADSEGEEGKFYVWTKDKLKRLLTDERYPLFAYHFGITRPANFERHYWHLHVHHEYEEVAKKYHLSLPEVKDRLDQARTMLFQHREHRVRPGRDDKILTSWNALMIKGMATAGQVLGHQEYLDAAFGALDFLRNHLWVNGQLLATYKDGKAHLNAYVDDYAFLLEALLILLQARWRAEDLRFAIQLADVLLAEFEDPELGGFFFTGHHHEKLISRPKVFADDFLPTGNAIAAMALGRLGYLVGDSRYLAAAEKTVQAAWINMNQAASANTSMLLALEDYLFPPQLIILRGTPNVVKVWQTDCHRQYAPQRLCFVIPNEADDLPEQLANKPPQGEAVAYICQGTKCEVPITSLEALRDKLGL